MSKSGDRQIADRKQPITPQPLKGKKMNEFLKQIWQIVVESNLLNVTGAILVLLIGYLTALVLGRKSTDLIQKAAARIIVLPNGTKVLPLTRTSRIFGRIVYCIIMLLAVLGCFSVLKLNAAAAPIQELISKVTAFLPNIAGALLLLFIAWLMAELLKMFCMAFLQTIKFNGKLPLDDAEKIDREKFILYVSKTAGCIVYLFFLPAILNALNIYGITQPLQSMFEEFLTFVPNLLAAAVILFAGLWAANIARRAIKALTIAGKINELGDKFEISGLLHNGSLSAMVGWTVYVLIALPVMIAALSALNIDVLSQAVAGFFGDVLTFAGEIAISAVLLLAVFFCGKFAARLVERFTAAWGIDSLLNGMCDAKKCERTVKLSVIAGKITRLALIVLAIVAVCDIFELAKLSSLIKRFALFGGNLILSCAVLLAGIKLANAAAWLIRGKCSLTIEYAVKAAVIIFTTALAISNLELGGSIVETAFALILGAFTVAAAIAFGIGGKETAARLLEQWLDKLKK